MRSPRLRKHYLLLRVENGLLFCDQQRMACLNGMRTGEQQQGSKFGRWLKGKLNAITHKEKLPKSSESLRQHGGARPLTDGASKSHARRKAKQQQAVTVSQHSANDDCSQVSSDQLSLVLSQQHSSR